MHERAKLSSDSSIEPRVISNDQFTDEENELINKLLCEMDTDEVKELAACKARLFVTEQEMVLLKALLDKTSSLLDEEVNRGKLNHALINDLRNKLKAFEIQQHLKQSTEMEEDMSVSPKPPAYEVGLRRRSLCERGSQARHSLFSVNANASSPKDDADDDYIDSCFKADSDSCNIL